MSRGVLLAVDLSYQTYRAAASHPMLSYEGVFTGGLYGFLTTLAKQIRETKATRVVICQDRKPYRRSLIYPEYKQLRKKNANEELLEAYNATTPLVLSALAEIGIPLLGVDGFESDDCIGWVVTKLRHRFDAIYAASNDSDLFQLLGHRSFKVLRKDIDDVMTLETLMSTTGLTPEEFMLASALQGTHNDIAGIPRVGELTAQRAVKDPGMLRQLRERWGELIERNLKLIKLPHPEFPGVRLPDHSRRFDHRSLYRFCSRFDIEVTKSMIDSFEQVSP